MATFRADNHYAPGQNLVTCAICAADRLSGDVVPKVMQAPGGGTQELWVCRESDRCNDPYHGQNDIGIPRHEELPRVRQKLS